MTDRSPWGTPAPRTLPFARALFALAIALLGLVAGTDAARAGTICGTVRDAVTAAPVAQAGVFLRSTAGAYLGIHAATDAGGTFCLSAVPAGTYDLEIRVDDYLVRFVRGVQVVDGTVGVDVDLGGPAFQLAAPAPNPAVGSVRFAFTLPAAGPVRLVLFDARGRVVHGWNSAELEEGRHSFAWDFRDAQGRIVPAGRYLLRMEAGSVVLHRSIVHLR